MAALDDRLKASCQMATLLILFHPDRKEEIETAIADVYRLSQRAVHELIRQQVDRLAGVERHSPDGTRNSVTPHEAEYTARCG